jgi:hypothetical protein
MKYADVMAYRFITDENQFKKLKADKFRRLIDTIAFNQHIPYASSYSISEIAIHRIYKSHFQQ